MKIRIRGNSLRIRINKNEVDELCAGGRLEEHTQFPNGRFTYILEQTKAGNHLSAGFEQGCIAMQVPESLTEGWSNNDVVGFDHHLALPDGGQLFLLLEKDFKCIDNTMMEDQSGNYDNPNHVCS
jgi:hypothetical protein